MGNLARFALTIGAVALISGCGGSHSPIGAPGVMPQRSALASRATSTNYKVLYSFEAPPDGNYPRAGLIDVGGTLYGTTEDGGSSTCGDSSHNYCGTVFSITTGGTEKVLYTFGSGYPDGSVPDSSLLDVHGTLYGTTNEGGSYTCANFTFIYGCGTVFSVTTSGTEKVLHSFGERGDGVGPVAPLIEVKGKLYGTTSAGGTHGCGEYTGGCGTVFSITTGGLEKVLHSFGAFRHPHDPLGSLIDAGGTLYGTTESGGRHKDGAVFSITLDGKLKVLHSFGEGTDGKFPHAGLIDLKGTFYGTTAGGGAYGSGTYGGGTVFSITPSGREKILHNFGNGTDGRNPHAGLVDLGGTLYGTTAFGGAHYCATGGSCGTVFSITPSGVEEVLHSFSGPPDDGKYPFASLIDVNGTLYATTYEGGAYNNGTAFALTP